jgi:hypothetical protein
MRLLGKRLAASTAGLALRNRVFGPGLLAAAANRGEAVVAYARGLLAEEAVEMTRH